MNRRVLPVAVLALSVFALVLAGCGSKSSTSTTTAAAGGGTTAASGGATTLDLTADASGALKFDKTSLEAPAGEVTIKMTNPSSVGHNIAIQGNGVDETGDTVTDGGVSTVTATLKAGTYDFLCTIDGHAAAGMKGTLTVK